METTSLNVTGEWIGSWTAFNPAHDAEPSHERRMRLRATITRKAGAWTTRFEAECGGDYCYTVDMNGRQVGDVVLFSTTTDLGEQDGGIFDWIGRATDREFIGFYTSAHYTGVFMLSRAS